MSYVLRIEKVDNAEFPGAERIQDPFANLLIPTVGPISLALPQIQLGMNTVQESGPANEPMGVYGRLVKMPSIPLKTKEASIEPMGVYGHLIKMPSIPLKTKEASIEPMGVYGRTIKMPSLHLNLEADSSSSMGALTRPQETNPKGTDHHKWRDCVDDVTNSGKPVDPYAICGASIQHKTHYHHGKKESAHLSSRIMTRFMESVSGTPDQSRYLVTLIQEGLGNLKDGFYYTANALEVGAALFEGQKCYANHPSAVEEEILPERSVRDIIGHFENVVCVVNGDHHEIQGELVVMGGPDYAWVQSQLDHALEFSQKYTDKDFVGLSINAGGQAEPMNIQMFIESYPIPPSCKPKVESAMMEGLAQVRIVDQITEAISCDLVTQAGAGGRILKAL